MRISDWSSDVCSSDLCCSHYSHTDAELYMRPVPPRLRNATSTPWFSCQPGSPACWCLLDRRPRHLPIQPILADVFCEIGRASCRERVCQYVYISVVAVSLKKKITHVVRTSSIN